MIRDFKSLPGEHRFVLGLFVVFLGMLGFACTNTCSTGAICGDSNVIGPSATPIPTPLPSPGATPDPCRIEAVRVAWMGGAQLPFLALGATEQLDATPVNSSGEVPKGCNVAREPLWQVLSPTTCQVIGGGYNPFVRGLRVGLCSVTATVANVVSTPFSVEVR